MSKQYAVRIHHDVDAYDEWTSTAAVAYDASHLVFETEAEANEYADQAVRFAAGRPHRGRDVGRVSQCHVSNGPDGFVIY